MTDTPTELPPLPLRTARPLGIPATVLRSKYQSTGPVHNGAGTLSAADEFVITATVAGDGTLSDLPHAARARRLDPGQPEAWLSLYDVFGRRIWAIVPAMPTRHRREPAAVRRYLSGWMASGNYARIQNSAALVEFYGAVAIHDHREWPPALPATAVERDVPPRSLLLGTVDLEGILHASAPDAGQYRWNGHTNELGDWCPWSNTAAPDPAEQRRPAGCPSSTPEPDERDRSGHTPSTNRTGLVCALDGMPYPCAEADQASPTTTGH
jgi:hypothetical protein